MELFLLFVVRTISYYLLRNYNYVDIYITGKGWSPEHVSNTKEDFICLNQAMIE